jgi:ubiquitin C-terminal hydrolase
LEVRVAARFHADPDRVQLFCNDRPLDPSLTLEMSGIGNDSLLTANYAVENRIDWLRFVIEYVMSTVEAASSGLAALHRADIPPDLGRAILKFLNRIVTPVEVRSMFDIPELAISQVENSLNPFGRCFYLRGIANVTADAEAKQKFAPASRLAGLIPEVSIREQRLILAILKNICPPDMEIDDGLVLSAIEAGSAKLVLSVFDFLIEFAKVNSERVYSIIQSHLLDLIGVLAAPQVVELVKNLPQKSEVFELLIPKIEELGLEEKCSHIYFEILFNAIDSSEHLRLVSQHLSKFRTAECPSFLFDSLCNFVCRFETDENQLPLDLLLSRIDSGATESSLTLLSKIYQNSPQIITLMRRFVSRSIPVFNADLGKQGFNRGLTGLLNLGATCYLNSGFQMLRCIPFSYDIANSVDLEKPWQLLMQKIFILLLGNDGLAVDTNEFIDHFQFRRGLINRTEAQDCFEFLQAILDGLPSEKTLCFRGTFSHFYQGVEIQYESQSDEPFFSLSVSIEGIHSLENSLQLYCQEEYIDDYQLPHFGKTRIRRSTRFQSMPDVLIVHLKRFVYNEGQRMKIGRRFSFPLELHNEYRLVGCVLHSGTAEVGHYHTIAQVNEQWYDFNDSHVTRYQIAKLEADAFGNDADNHCQCAYILSYSRIPMVEQELTSRYLVKDNLMQARRTLLASSAAFFELAQKCEESIFLFLYFFNILLHLQSPERCEVIRVLLTKMMLAARSSRTILQMLLSDLDGVFYVYYRVDDEGILQSWTKFLKSMVLATQAGMKDIINFLVSLMKLMVSPAKALMLVDLVRTFVSMNRECMNLASELQWHIKILIFIFTWYKTAKNFAESVDFSAVFEVFTYFVPVMDQAFITDLQTLSPRIERSQVHVAAWFRLLQVVMDR